MEPATAVPIATAARPPLVSAAPEAAGERRHVTVMFCDLVDFDRHSGETRCRWRDLVGTYLDAASTAVTEFGGKVAKKLGDGLMALFGYPVAQENDAERAVRAAIAIQRALAELNRKNADTGKPALAARIAMDSGPVVVDPAGEIFGDVPNITAGTSSRRARCGRGHGAAAAARWTLRCHKSAALVRSFELRRAL